MESSTSHQGLGPTVAPEFGTWPIQGNTLENANKIRSEFDDLLKSIAPMFPKGNERYLSLVKTNLETACLYAIKGVSKPTGNGVANA